MTTFCDHFAAVADSYADHRPTYPPELFSWLAALAPSRELAWDCATGSGQAATALAGHFRRVWATDASAAQIAAAVPCAGVTYRTAPAEASGLPDGSADLVTVAQALHWLDLQPFYAEVHRVLKPGGVLAVWTYGVFEASGDDASAVQPLLDRFYHQTVGPFWPPERRHVENGYGDLPFPFDQLASPPLAMAVQWSLDDLAGYLRSWSAVSRYRQQHGSDPVLALLSELAPHWQGRRRVTWPLSVKAGRI